MTAKECLLGFCVRWKTLTPLEENEKNRGGKLALNLWYVNAKNCDFHSRILVNV
jgi:hypothetical protein